MWATAGLGAHSRTFETRSTRGSYGNRNRTPRPRTRATRNRPRPSRVAYCTRTRPRTRHAHAHQRARVTRDAKSDQIRSDNHAKATVKISPARTAHRTRYGFRRTQTGHHQPYRSNPSNCLFYNPPRTASFQNSFFSKFFLISRRQSSPPPGQPRKLTTPME